MLISEEKKSRKKIPTFTIWDFSRENSLVIYNVKSKETLQFDEKIKTVNFSR